MADAIFDRTTYGFREKPISDDWNREGSQADRTIRDLMMYILGGRSADTTESMVPRDVCWGTGLSVVPSSPAAMTVQLNAGLAFQYLTSGATTDIGYPDLLGVDDQSAFRPLVLNTPQVMSVPTAPSVPNSRIDIIEVRAERALTDALTRRQLNATTGAFDPHNFYKTLTHVLDGLTGTVASPSDSTQPISYKTGVAGAPGAVPATTAGYIKLAEILVNNGTTSITAAEIVDRRRMAAPAGIMRGSFRLRIQNTGTTPTFTWRSVCLPPGVKICAGIHVAAQRASARIYVVAGEATEVSLTAQVSPLSAILSTAQAFLTVQSPLTSGADFVQTADSTLKAALAASTPATTIAVGQKVIAQIIEGRYITDTGAGTTDINVTDAFLEDVEVEGTISIAYH